MSISLEKCPDVFVDVTLSSGDSAVVYRLQSINLTLCSLKQNQSSSAFTSNPAAVANMQRFLFIFAAADVDFCCRPVWHVKLRRAQLFGRRSLRHIAAAVTRLTDLTAVRRSKPQDSSPRNRSFF